MFIVFTGNPGVGKTMILNMLEEKGLQTYNIDNFVDEIYKKDRIGYSIILNEFGPKFVSNNQVNKKALKDYVIQNDEARVKLEKLIWPIIRNHLIELKKKNRNLIVEMAIYKINPNFFEGIFDFVIEVKNKRVNNKNNKLGSLFNNKNINADFVVNNSWTLDYTRFVIEQLFDIIGE